jgi:hypothetical protein
MPAYELDPMHPDVLRCCHCHAPVANVGDLAQRDPDPPQEMTARQALACWPGAALEVVRHDVLCSWRQREAEGTASNVNCKTSRLFRKHGMTLVGFWSPLDAKQASNKMVYILAFPSKAAADKAWEAFREDPEWLKAKAESERNGKLVERIESVYLSPTDYSPLK